MFLHFRVKILNFIIFSSNKKFKPADKYPVSSLFLFLEVALILGAKTGRIGATGISSSLASLLAAAMVSICSEVSGTLLSAGTEDSEEAASYLGLRGLLLAP